MTQLIYRTEERTLLERYVEDGDIIPRVGERVSRGPDVWRVKDIRHDMVFSTIHITMEEVF